MTCLETNFKQPHIHQLVHVHPISNQPSSLSYEQLTTYIEWAVEAYKLVGMKNLGWALDTPNSEFSQLFAGLAAGCTVVPYSMQGNFCYCFLLIALSIWVVQSRNEL
jgi:hypothetical protein